MKELFTRPDRADVLRVGLTGGIASGKSTVARRLAEHGALVVDADAIARELQEPGAVGYEAVLEHFGPAVVRDDGALDRVALARIVFGDPAQLEALNGIMHPLVRARTSRLLADVPPGGVVVHDIPLLVETGQHEQMDRVLVVEAPEAERVRRMVEDRGMAEQDARRRIAAQAKDEDRRAVATTVLENTGSIAELEAQVDEWWNREAA